MLALTSQKCAMQPCLSGCKHITVYVQGNLDSGSSGNPSILECLSPTQDEWVGGWGAAACHS